MNNIAFFETENWEKDYLLKELSGFEVSFFEKHLEEENIELAKPFQIISSFTNSQINQKVITGLPNLKMIAIRATGFDHIDIDTTQKNNIVVSNVPVYGENTVAEHTFALILDLSRNIYKSIRGVKEKGFIMEGSTGFDLQGKTLGVIGTGHIGKHVIKIANGFEMDVLAYDVMPDKKLAKKMNFQYVSLEQLLSKSDIVSIHVPYNKNTHYLINSSNISLIKKGSYLINTARGGIVETEAMVKALEGGILAGVGLDVLEEEHDIKEERQLISKKFSKEHNFKTLLENHILMELDNVIITPHNAFNSKEALERILKTTVENIKAFAKGKPINTV